MYDVLTVKELIVVAIVIFGGPYFMMWVVDKIFNGIRNLMKGK